MSAVPDRFADKVVVLTDAAAGIGEATARRLKDEGVTLLLADVDELGLESLAAELDGSGKRVAWRRVDVGEEHDNDDLIEMAVNRFGRIDVLINNASIGAFGRRAPRAWCAGFLWAF